MNVKTEKLYASRVIAERRMLWSEDVVAQKGDGAQNTSVNRVGKEVEVLSKVAQ